MANTTEKNTGKKVVGMTAQEFKQYIISEAMKYIDNGIPIDLEMNKMDKSQMTDGSKEVRSEKDTSPDVKLNFVSATDQKDVKMNANAKEQGQIKDSGEKVVESIVQATGGEATKTGPSIEGQHKAKLETKSGNPDIKVSQPYTDVAETNTPEGQKKLVSKMDNEGDHMDTAHATVQPDGEVKTGFKTGGHKADFKDSAKTVNEKETIERIATGIQLPETFKNKTELLEFIDKQAKKILTSLK